MATQVRTSVQAFNFARKLVDDYDRRKFQERDLNKKKEEKVKTKSDQPKEGPSRTVTEIDYDKHENTVKELDRQEKEERYQKKKQEAAQWCTLDHEHGPNCRRPVGGCSHDHQKEWGIYEKSTEEKIKAADRFRQEGNEAYKKQNYGLAAVHYRKALLQFDYTFAEGEQEEKWLDSVKVPCLLNLAACKCQQEEWDEVLTHCRLALEIDPRSVKAFYRTGLAHLARDNFELAKDSLLSAHEIEPNNGEVMNALKRLKEKMDNYKVRQVEVYREMVSGTTDGETAEARTAVAVAAEAARAEAEAAAEAEQAGPDEPAGGGDDEDRSAAAPKDSPDRPGQVPPAAAAAAATAGGAAGRPDDDTAASAQGRQAESAPVRAAESKAASTLMAAAPEAASAGSLRRRGAPTVQADEETEDDAEHEKDTMSAAQKRTLNAILVVAVGLAVTSAAVCTAVFLAQ